MGRNIPLGRLAGIKVSMDITVILLAGFYSVALATSRFPYQSPDLSTTAYWVAGVSGALLFFVSLLVHEMGHALVAKDEGIGVRGISLWLLGGVAKLESSPTTARSEFRIAVVGPLASASCGVVFLSLAYAIPSGGLPGLAGHLFELLGRLNLLLAAFNLLPAAPLDGGTVLSSIVWKRTGSQATGMKWAARAGLAAGAAMVAFGVTLLRGGSGQATVNGWSLLLVGGFITMAALQSLRSQPLYALLDGTTVREAMVTAPPMAMASASVADFLRTMGPQETAQAYPMVDERGMVTGLLTASAIRAVPDHRWEHVRVVDLAFPVDRLTVVAADEALLPAVQKIDGGDVRHGLVVIDDGSVIGTIDAKALFETADRRKAELVPPPPPATTLRP
ncbi:MAG: site-2 protease family protein [Aquihabitans sp.]